MRLDLLDRLGLLDILDILDLLDLSDILDILGWSNTTTMRGHGGLVDFAYEMVFEVSLDRRVKALSPKPDR